MRTVAGVEHATSPRPRPFTSGRLAKNLARLRHPHDRSAPRDRPARRHSTVLGRAVATPCDVLAARACVEPSDAWVAYALLSPAAVTVPRLSNVTRHALRCVGELYVVAASGLAVAALTRPMPRPTPAFVAAMLVPVVGCFAALALRSAAHARRTWSRRRRGADVGRALLSLPDAYRVLSRLPLTLRREDRVVIGSNGIFVVVTDDTRRRRDGSFWRAMIDDCHIEALRVRARVRRALRRPLPVHAVLCVAEDPGGEIQQTQGVRVVDTSRLATMIVNTFTTAPLRAADVEAAATALAATGVESAPVTRRQRARPRQKETDSERRLMLV